jgi:hypothetical protein
MVLVNVTDPGINQSKDATGRLRWKPHAEIRTNHITPRVYFKISSGEYCVHVIRNLALCNQNTRVPRCALRRMRL